MLTLVHRFFDVSRYRSSIEQGRARLILILAAMGLTLFTIFAFRVSPSSGLNLFQTALEIPAFGLIMLLFYVFSFLNVIMTKLGYLRYSSIGGMAAWYMIGVVTAILGGIRTPEHGMAFLVFIMLGGLLNETRGIIAAEIIGLFSLVLGFLARANIPGAPPPQNSFPDGFLYFFVMLGTGIITYMFVRFSSLARIEGATRATEDRLRLAEITTDLSQSTSRREPLTNVLATLVEQILAAYPSVYHAQIFLVDETGQDAKLVASTGDVGKLLLARGHSLGVGSLSVIGQVTVRREPIIDRAGREDSIHRRNEFLPETAVEAAFPLTIGTIVVGALDLQSRFSEAFDRAETVKVFTSLADSIAIAVDNARLFEQTEQRIRENQRLVEQTRGALREVEQLNERLTGRAWSEYLRNKTDDFSVKLEFDADDTQPDRIGKNHESAWSQTLEEAIRLNYVVQDTQDGKRVIAVPLRVRGQVVGAMEFEMDDDGKFTGEEMNLVQEVGERFGLAAENTRLLEESQRLALRESLVNEISNRLQASNNVETTLTEAARSLQDSLKAAKVSIRLGQPPKETTR
jgi:GAF domain-containing protein